MQDFCFNFSDGYAEAGGLYCCGGQGSGLMTLGTITGVWKRFLFGLRKWNERRVGHVL